MRPWAQLQLAAAGVVLAVVPMAYLSGFTVDDALIPARYAAHLAAGQGYRFNVTGPVTDGVTPLGFPYLLSPFAAGGPLGAFTAARLLGALAWIAASARLAVAIGQVPGRPLRFASLLLILVSAPLAAWSAAGLETGIVMALSAQAAVAPATGRGARAGALCGGLAAWLRPELIAFAGVLGWGRARQAASPRERAQIIAVTAVPWVMVSAVRMVLWGRPAPLAVLAKPSDLHHGIAYVAACALLTGGPLAAFAPWAWRRLPVWPRVLLAASAVHLVVVACAGGDWMPLSRLVTPVLPALALVTAHLAENEKPAVWALRLALAVAGEGYAFATVGPRARQVLHDRMALIEAARGTLVGAQRVATVDVGWVGIATDAELVDLAGATDPEIAALPGGHTSKLVSGALLEHRGADHLVLLLAPGGDEGDPPRFERTVERRLARDPIVAERYRIISKTPADRPLRYAIFLKDLS